MIESKAWDWSKNQDNKWLIPSVESAYLAERWECLGFRKLFDLGCGLGRHSLYFAEKGFEVTASDLSELAIENVKKAALERGLQITVRSCDMLALPYENESFDCLMAYNVIYHTDTAGFLKTLSEIERVLKPGGEFYLTLISKNTWSFQNASRYRKIDENSILRDDDDTERGVPHFYVDIRDIVEYFEKFELMKLPIEETEYNITSPDHFSKHFTVLARKSK